MWARLITLTRDVTAALEATARSLCCSVPDYCMTVMVTQRQESSRGVVSNMGYL